MSYQHTSLNAKPKKVRKKTKMTKVLSIFPPHLSSSFSFPWKRQCLHLDVHHSKRKVKPNVTHARIIIVTSFCQDFINNIGNHLIYFVAIKYRLCVSVYFPRRFVSFVVVVVVIFRSHAIEMERK